MKKTLLLICFSIWCFSVYTQKADTLTIESCISIAGRQSSLNRQKVITDEILRYKLDNLTTDWLPSVGLNAQASYNSETIDFSDILGKFPGVSLPSLPLDQYKAWADINQQIYDGGLTKSRKQIERTSAEADKQQTESELLALRQQVSQVYFSILLTEKNTQVITLSLEELKEKRKTIQSGVNYGAVLPEVLQSLDAQEVALQQRITELTMGRDQLVKTLSILMDSVITDNTAFAEPLGPLGNDNAKRPELLLFEQQQELLKANQKLLVSADFPKVFAFSQVAYGRPGYNMLSNDFHTFYTIGAGLKWNFLNYGDNKRQKKILEVQKDLIEIKKENFNDKLRIQLETEKSNMEKYDRLITMDAEIVKLRKSISASSLSRLNNGIITATDYLTDFNAEIMASLQLENHKIMRMQSAYNYLLIQGKL